MARIVVQRTTHNNKEDDPPLKAVVQMHRQSDEQEENEHYPHQHGILGWFRETIRLLILPESVSGRFRKRLGGMRSSPPPSSCPNSNIYCRSEVPLGIQKLHKAFIPRLRHYSPLQGKIFICNGLVIDLYRYPSRDQPLLWRQQQHRREPGVDLVHHLFEASADGEIEQGQVIQAIFSCAMGRRQQQGQESNPFHRVGAHLSPAFIGEFFETMERLRNNLAFAFHKDDMGVVRQELSQVLFDQIGNDSEYRLVRKQLDDQVSNAHVALLPLEHKINGRKKQNRHLIPSHPLTAVTDVQQYVNYMGLQQDLRTAQLAVRMEEENRRAFASTLVDCFFTYELGYGRPSNLPKFSTTAILLSYLWDKYHTRPEAFRGYVQAMSRLGALNCSVEDALTLLEEKDGG